jgi:hypothetical protein
MRRAAPVLAVALVLALVFGVLLVADADAQASRQKFDWVQAKRLTVETDASVGDDLDVTDVLTVGGAANLAGNSSVGGTFSVTGNTAVGGDLTVVRFLGLTKTGSLTVASGGTITPTASMQMLTAAGAVGAGLGLGTSGQLVTLINSGTNAITISDTVNSQLSGNIALGQYDSLTVVFDGTYWIQVATSNN